jgi:tetratricopeptide (TPR) repeat protein
VALSLENMANIHIYQGNTKKALTLTNECIGIYTKLAYKPGLMASYSNRGSEFDFLMQFDNSIRDLNISIELARELNDKYQEIKNISNIGVVYWHMKKPGFALRYLNRALEMSDESDDAYNIDNTLKTIAEIYTYQKQYSKANEILVKVLKRNEELENGRQVAVIMTAMGRNLIELNEIDKAMGYLSKSLEITVRINAPYEILENYRNLAHAHAILHNFSAADSLQDLFAETYSGLFNSDSIADTRRKNKMSDGIAQTSTSSLSDWIIAFLLFALLMIVSVLTYSRNNG